MAKLELMNYDNQKVETPVDLDRLDEIEEIRITVISGDEIVDVVYSNRTGESYDSARLLEDPRITGFYDGSYILYSKSRNINLLDAFMEREDSYDWPEGAVR